MNWFLLRTHYLVIFVAMLFGHVCRPIVRRFLIPTLRLLAIPVFGLLTLFLLDMDDYAGNGTSGAWRPIDSVVTPGGAHAWAVDRSRRSGCWIRWGGATQERPMTLISFPEVGWCWSQCGSAIKSTVPMLPDRL